MTTDAIWEEIRTEAEAIALKEPLLANVFEEGVLKCPSLEAALSRHLAQKLSHNAPSTSKSLLKDTFMDSFDRDLKIGVAVRRDIRAFRERDPACHDFLGPAFYYKGVQALTSYRVAHHLWSTGRHELAFYLESLISEVFAVDIHPAATIGCGVLLDHATGFVAGETTVIDSNVSILHEVTLGGTGKESGDRHPKIRSGVLIGAGAKILGNVEVGQGARIGAGSVVLKDIPPHSTAAGVPAKIVGRSEEADPALRMEHDISDCI